MGDKMTISDERLGAKAGTDRKERAMEDRAVTQSRELTEKDRLTAFRQALQQSALPKLPDIPGYHLYWASTSNKNEPIHRKLQLGYELLLAKDVPGYNLGELSIKTGDWVGCIGINEMIAMKLPLDLYYMYMKENHHDQPLFEDQKLTDTADSIREQAERVGSKVEEFSGISGLRHEPPRPDFSQV